MLENVNKLGCKISMHKKMGCGLYEELLELLVKVQGCAGAHELLVVDNFLYSWYTL